MENWRKVSQNQHHIFLPNISCKFANCFLRRQLYMKCQSLFSWKNMKNAICLVFPESCSPGLALVSHSVHHSTFSVHLPPRSIHPPSTFLPLSFHIPSIILPHSIWGWLGVAKVTGILHHRGDPTDIGFQLGKACYPFSRQW